MWRPGALCQRRFPLSHYYQSPSLLFPAVCSLHMTGGVDAYMALPCSSVSPKAANARICPAKEAARARRSRSCPPRQRRTYSTAMTSTRWSRPRTLKIVCSAFMQLLTGQGLIAPQHQRCLIKLMCFPCQVRDCGISISRRWLPCSKATTPTMEARLTCRWIQCHRP